MNYPCLEITKTFTKLNLSPFGRMKLSLIPEGILYSVYKHFSNNDQPFPTFSKFFDHCLTQCKSAKIDMKSRWRRFFNVCKDLHINIEKELPTVIPSSPETIMPQRPKLTSFEIEQEFWKSELHKITPLGKHAMQKLGDPHSPFRNQMIDLHQHNLVAEIRLFNLYLEAYPQQHKPSPWTLLEKSISIPAQLTIYHHALQATALQVNALDWSTQCDQHGNSAPANDSLSLVNQFHSNDTVHQTERPIILNPKNSKIPFGNSSPRLPEPSTEAHHSISKSPSLCQSPNLSPIKQKSPSTLPPIGKNPIYPTSSNSSKMPPSVPSTTMIT